MMENGGAAMAGWYLNALVSLTVAQQMRYSLSRGPQAYASAEYC